MKLITLLPLVFAGRFKRMSGTYMEEVMPFRFWEPTATEISTRPADTGDAIKEFLGDHATEILKHGCHCSAFHDHFHDAHDTFMDPVDFSCQKWRAARTCIHLKGGPCHLKKHVKYNINNGICVEGRDTCAGATCMVDLFHQRIINMEISYNMHAEDYHNFVWNKKQCSAQSTFDLENSDVNDILMKSLTDNGEGPTKSEVKIQKEKVVAEAEDQFNDGFGVIEDVKDVDENHGLADKTSNMNNDSKSNSKDDQQTSFSSNFSEEKGEDKKDEKEINYSEQSTSMLHEDHLLPKPSADKTEAETSEKIYSEHIQNSGKNDTAGSKSAKHASALRSGKNLFKMVTDMKIEREQHQCCGIAPRFTKYNTAKKTCENGNLLAISDESAEIDFSENEFQTVESVKNDHSSEEESKAEDLTADLGDFFL